MENFDAGGFPSFIDQVFDAFLTILSFPLTSSRLTKLFPGVSGWFLIGANSLLWGVGLRSLAVMLFNKINPPKP